MNIEAAFIEALFYVSLILSVPVLFTLSRVLTRYLLNRYVSDAEIIVTYKRKGTVVGVKKIRTTAYVVDQIKSLQGEGA